MSVCTNICRFRGSMQVNWNLSTFPLEVKRRRNAKGKCCVQTASGQLYLQMIWCSRQCQVCCLFSRCLEIVSSFFCVVWVLSDMNLVRLISRHSWMGRKHINAMASTWTTAQRCVVTACWTGCRPAESFGNRYTDRVDRDRQICSARDRRYLTQ